MRARPSLPERPARWLLAALAIASACGGGPRGGAAEDAAEVDSAVADSTAADTEDDADLAVLIDGSDADIAADDGDADDTVAPDTVTDADADAMADADTSDSDADVPDADADAAGDVDATPCVPGEACALSVYPGPCKTGVCDPDGACVATEIPGCCSDDSDCEGEQYQPSSACETFRCVSSQCTATRYPSCCDETLGCDDGVACTVDRCGADTGLCTHCPTACACAPPLLVSGFDSTAFDAGFMVVDDTTWDAVTWRVTSRRALVPPGAAYLGRADCPSYYTGSLGDDCGPADPIAQDGARVNAALVTPAFTLSARAAAPRATVWLWADVEPVLGLGPAEPDVLRILVEPLDGAGGATWEVASSLAVGKVTMGGWRLLTADLAPWIGRTVRLRFAFDTLDGQANAYEGVYLDQLRVTEGCEAGGCCQADGDCADTGDPCTVARCVAMTDGAGRTCVAVPAHPGQACAPCASAASCGDADPCTNDLCGADGACVHEAFCCLRRDVWSDGFEDGLAHWATFDDQPADAVRWTVSNHAFDGVYAAWFGSPASGDYATGAQVRGALASPLLTLPFTSADGGVELAFALELDTEWSGAAAYDNPAGVDRLTITLLTVTDEIVVWTSDAIAGTTGGEWRPIAVDLTPWAGQTIQLRLTFDSVDGDANQHGGVWIDDLAVRTACPGGG